MEPDRSDPKKSKPPSNFLRYSNLTLQLFAAIGLSAWAGHSLDSHLSFRFPVFLLSFVLIAFVGMMIQLYRNFNKD
jgi:Putative F0F1-ATPase subunit Ca2+/Mg2+ transporter